VLVDPASRLGRRARLLRRRLTRTAHLRAPRIAAGDRSARQRQPAGIPVPEAGARVDGPAVPLPGQYSRPAAGGRTVGRPGGFGAWPLPEAEPAVPRPTLRLRHHGGRDDFGGTDARQREGADRGWDRGARARGPALAPLFAGARGARRRERTGRSRASAMKFRSAGDISPRRQHTATST